MDDKEKLDIGAQKQDIEEEKQDIGNEKQDIEDDDDERYRLTPRGIALEALLDLDLVPSTEAGLRKFNRFWQIFVDDMRKAGYVEGGDENG